MKSVVVILILLGSMSLSFASDKSPWGTAQRSHASYEPRQVLYDLTSGDEKTIITVLDRISFLSTLYGNHPFDSSIVVVVHGASIPFFATAAFAKYKATMERAQSLTVGSNIEFRMCQASAKLQGFEPGEIHGFVKMVPMADAEIIKLQHEGYAYLQ